MNTETSIKLLAALVEMKSSFTSQMTAMENMIHQACLQPTASTQNKEPNTNQTVRGAASNGEDMNMGRSLTSPRKRTLPLDRPGPESKTSRSVSLDVRKSSNEPMASSASKAAKVKSSRKTIDGNLSMAEQAKSIVHVALAKNTNIDQHVNNTLYNSLCLYCGVKERFLVRHYINQHCGFEVPIARPSPNMANKIRSHVEMFAIELVKIKGMCYFCEEVKEMRRLNWMQHYSTHTGEPLYACNTCNQQFDRKVQKHANCLGEVLNISEINSTDDGSLMAFMCKDCNYMQMHLPSMQKHLRKQHGYAMIAEGHQYDKVTLVPDLSPVQTNLMTEYELIATRFECTLCNAPILTAKEFIQHYDENHNDINEYTCLCGKKITSNGGNLTSKLIVDHLYLHSNVFYHCVLCDSIFDGKSGIRCHITSAHRNDENIKFRQFTRGPGQTPRVNETIIRKYQCNLCKTTTNGTFAAIFDHFKEVHKLTTIEATAIISRKLTYFDKASSGMTSYTGCTYSVIKSLRSSN